MRKAISLILIMAGLSMAFFPQAASTYSDMEQRHLLDKWKEQEFKEMDLWDERAEGKKTEENLLGQLTIPKIGLEMPIVEGATEANLHSASAHITGTSQIGKVGNAAIAGHRSRQFGRKFNRLNELETGDVIQVATAEGTFSYRVTKKWIVTPEQVQVLDKEGSVRLLTLVTCHPVDQPTKRLIVKAEQL
ncbi:sortase [Bacillus mangrovi]|uniref:Sortase n=1 Tax=Metabacillus mangrovi TaxID=1491830 RepID=A0A7X2S6F0_9BACI|nr:class D sortase [Metabacillus mangrovi]MTH54534.1 sortase [Metabacillus mangrovi]